MPNFRKTLLRTIPSTTKDKTLRYHYATSNKVPLAMSYASRGDDDDDYWNDSSTYGEEW